VDAALLERADHLEAGTIADVREPRIFVPAEVALEDATVLRAIEEGAPRLELVHASGGLHRVELRHSPLIEVPTSLHRVAEVDLPVVLRLDVAQRRSDPALGHHRVRLAEERFADQSDAQAHRARLDGGAEPGKRTTVPLFAIDVSPAQATSSLEDMASLALEDFAENAAFCVRSRGCRGVASGAA
jgi:hypothetical protein